MIDIAWSEFLFIALVALILIGPKELPTVLRNIGRWVGKARAFAKDLSAQLDLESGNLHDEMDNPAVDNLPQKKVSSNNDSVIEVKTGPFGNTNENPKP